MQIVQLHVLTGYQGKDHLSVTLYFTAPHWQDPVCVVRSVGEVSSTKRMWGMVRGGAEEKVGV